MRNVKQFSNSSLNLQLTRRLPEFALHWWKLENKEHVKMKAAWFLHYESIWKEMPSNRPLAHTTIYAFLH